MMIIDLKSKANDSLRICCVYRSPNSSNEENNNINKQLEALSGENSHILVMGDFNFPDIDWKRWVKPRSKKKDKEFFFLESIRNCFLYQHVKNPTRSRVGKRATLLDLIFSNEKGMVSNIVHESPLGASDHACITFSFNCYLDITNSTLKKPDFHKANYNKINDALGKVNWEEVLEGKNVEDTWEQINQEVNKANKDNVPLKQATPKMKKKFLTPLDQNALRKIKKKHQMWKKFMESRESKDYRELCKVRNNVRKMTREMRKNKEKKNS